MTYRILLMASGLLMMFAVYGLVMTIGALVDDSDAWIGNFSIGATFTILAVAAVSAGIVLRRKVQARLEAEINRQFEQFGYVDASLFATCAKVTMDDARDQLDRRAREGGWLRRELEQYNAHYFLSNTTL
jgi:hypothetical protein